MSRARAVVAEDEVPTLAEALETVAPLLQELEALESIRTFLTYAVRMKADLPKLQDEYETLAATVSRLRTMRSELRDTIGEGVRAVIDLQKTGIKITLPESVREWGHTT